MIGLFSPISFNTQGINQIGYNYFYGGACGFGATFPYYPLSGMMSAYALYNPYMFGSNMIFMGYNNPYMMNPMGLSYVYSSQGASSSSSSKKAEHSQKQKEEVNKSLTRAEKTALRTKIIDTAEKYSNCQESDNSHLKFCINSDCKHDDPENEEWCTDFVSYVIKEVFKAENKTLPEGFGFHDVSKMKKWAEKNGKFLDVTEKSNKADYISRNIKKGDIVIFLENGASHTGIVTKVYSDGTFDTIEGNVGDTGGTGNGKVENFSHKPNESNLSGFIRIV